ncbi:MAG: pyroglutamyl-peptidase I [Muribaculaceae bacterium]|nr:pyroglutamyl-peptidase I [Muribaculaceae bacterium]
MKVLVTYFEPFGDDSINSSEECAKLLPEDIETLRLPVSFRRAPQLAITRVEELRPDMVICLGQAVRPVIALERIAINMANAAKPDNDGYCPHSEHIVSGGSDGIFTTYDVDSLAARLRDSGYPCQVSNSAGTYVCNALYYLLLQRGIPALFVHLPLTPEQARIRPTVTSFVESALAAQSIITLLSRLYPQSEA